MNRQYKVNEIKSGSLSAHALQTVTFLNHAMKINGKKAKESYQKREERDWGRGGGEGWLKE